MASSFHCSKVKFSARALAGQFSFIHSFSRVCAGMIFAKLPRKTLRLWAKPARTMLKNHFSSISSKCSVNKNILVRTRRHRLLAMRLALAPSRSERSFRECFSSLALIIFKKLPTDVIYQNYRRIDLRHRTKESFWHRINIFRFAVCFDRYGKDAFFAIGRHDPLRHFFLDKEDHARRIDLRSQKFSQDFAGYVIRNVCHNDIFFLLKADSQLDLLSKMSSWTSFNFPECDLFCEILFHVFECSLVFFNSDDFCSSFQKPAWSKFPFPVRFPGHIIPRSMRAA